MKKPKFTKEEGRKLDILRQSIDRYQNLLQWQKLRRAEKKLLELRLRYDYRSYRRSLCWISISSLLGLMPRNAGQTSLMRETDDYFNNCFMVHSSR